MSKKILKKYRHDYHRISIHALIVSEGERMFQIMEKVDKILGERRAKKAAKEAAATITKIVDAAPEGAKTTVDNHYTTVTVFERRKPPKTYCVISAMGWGNNETFLGEIQKHLR